MDNKKTVITIDKNAHGWSQKKALENAQNIAYLYEYYDSQLILDPYWISPAEQKFSGEHRELLRIRDMQT